LDIRVYGTKIHDFFANLGGENSEANVVKHKNDCLLNFMSEY